MNNLDNKTLAKIQLFIDDNPLAVLGTINDDGSPHGAVVYVCADDHRPVLYLATKVDTQKYRNLLARSVVSLTVFNVESVATLQASGRAVLVRDAQTLDMATRKLTDALVKNEEWLPPIAKLRAGAYTMIGIELTDVRLGEFKNKKIGDDTIFSEVRGV